MPVSSKSSLRQTGERPREAPGSPALPASPEGPQRGAYRVLKIAPTSFFADYGCHVRIFEESRVLRRLGHQVAIVTYHTGRDVDGLDIRRAVNTPWRRSIQVGSSVHKLYYDVLLSLKTLQTALSFRPTVVHAHLHEGALIGYPISRALRVPLVFDFQGSLTSEMLDHAFLKAESRLFGPLYRLERLVNRLADRIITSSQNAADILVQEFGMPPGRVTTLADSVDTTAFLPRRLWPDQVPLRRLRAALGLPEDRPIVVYLGLLAGYQGTGLLLEAASILAQRGVPAHFLVMGFPGEDAYRAQAVEMGLAEYVTFTGRIPYLEAPLHLALGDVAVSPKMSETEGNGKLLNYMAAGLPTVAFDTPVAREILGPAGVYAAKGDSTDLATALEVLLSDGALRKQRAEQVRARAVEYFSWDETGRQLVDIYGELGARLVAG